MHCPFCLSNQISVINTRSIKTGIWRRRKCLKCHKKFTTAEKFLVTNVLVIKRSGKTENFDPQKIFLGICHAGHESKRLSKDQIRKTANLIVREVETEVITSDRHSLKSQSIGKSILSKLQKHSPELYHRFKAFFLSNY